MMFSLVYKSVATLLLNSDELKTIHHEASIANKKKDITGCLLHHNGNFVQLLEGSKEDVLNLYEKIKQDSRHKNVVLMSSENSSFRMFKDWNMIFHNIDYESEETTFEKMKFFEKLYNSSDTNLIPNLPKIALWREAFKIFNPSLDEKQFH